MRTKSLASVIIALLAFPAIATAQDAKGQSIKDMPMGPDSAAAMAAEHGGGVYHAIRLETDIGHDDGDTTASWDLDGWIGGDINKLWLKSEGELRGAKTEKAEAWALYSRNVSTFWDAQVGLRQDFQTAGGGKAHTYLTAGINGLAPYFFDTEAHVFVRDDGAISARFRQENEILLTNRLIVKPRLEINLNGQADRAIGLGTGVTDAALGLQTRYEISRHVAPYIDLKYEKKFGQTADFARLRGEKPESTTLTAGIRWLF